MSKLTKTLEGEILLSNLTRLQSLAILPDFEYTDKQCITALRLVATALRRKQASILDCVDLGLAQRLIQYSSEFRCRKLPVPAWMLFASSSGVEMEFGSVADPTAFLRMCIDWAQSLEMPPIPKAFGVWNVAEVKAFDVLPPKVRGMNAQYLLTQGERKVYLCRSPIVSNFALYPLSDKGNPVVLKEAGQDLMIIDLCGVIETVRG